MAPATATRLLTAEEFYDWANRPEHAGRYWELDRGEVIEMPPPMSPHGTLCSWIAHLLWMYALGRGRGRVTSNDSGLVVANRPDTVRGVDVMFFDEALPLARIPRQYDVGLPALVVEVWSPSDRRNQMNRRVAQYLARGVPLIWLVDPEDETVAVYRRGDEMVLAAGADELTGAPALPDFRCRAADLFTLPGATPTT
jgi:Uma2 family endonuclease